MRARQRAFDWLRFPAFGMLLILASAVQLGCRDTLDAPRLKSPIRVDGVAADWEAYPRTYVEDAGVSLAFVNSDSVLYCLVQRRISTRGSMMPVTLWFEPRTDKGSPFGVLLSIDRMGGRRNGLDRMVGSGESGEPTEMPGDEQEMNPGDRLRMRLRTGVQSEVLIRYGSGDERTTLPADGSAGIVLATGVDVGVVVQELAIPLGAWAGFNEFGETARLALNAAPGAKLKVSLSYVQLPGRGMMRRTPGEGMGGRPGGGMGGRPGGGMGGDIGEPPQGEGGEGQLPQARNRRFQESTESINLRLAE